MEEYNPIKATSIKYPNRKDFYFFYKEMTKCILKWEAEPLQGGNSLITENTDMRKGGTGPVLSAPSLSSSLAFSENSIFNLERTEGAGEISYRFWVRESPYRHNLTRKIS